MRSRVLLINFEERYAEQLTKDLNVHAERGYLSDVSFIEQHGELPVEEIAYYFPHPVYEYEVVVGNLSSDKSLEATYKDEVINLDKRIGADFLDYWSNHKGVIIIFLGDYRYQGLLTSFGIPHVSLTEVSSRDITAKFVLEERSSFRKALRRLEKDIVMPTKKYISFKAQRGEDWVIYSIYKNLRDSILGCYYNDRPYDNKDEAPSFIILPQFKDNLYVITILLRELARIYPKFLGGLYEADWMESDRYYPGAVAGYGKRIADYKKEAEGTINKLIEERDQIKKEYENLRRILYEKNDELKRSVIEVLEKYWSLRVTDMDEEEKIGGKKSLKEDILIEEGDRKILAEVKGTDSAYPSPWFITQVWQHLHYSGLGTQAEGALIMNYDIKTDPSQRGLAYNSEDESQVEDIIFIDTRVLFELTIAMIDYGLPLQKAKEILLRKGRVKSDLDDYKKDQTGT